jgi:hypothetical protein
MTKERMKDLLIIGMLPFLVVAYQTTDWSFLSPLDGQERRCAIYHQHAKPSHKCDVYDKPKLYFHD